MNAVHPMQYHLIKAEEAHRLARIERRAMAQSAEKSPGASQHHQPDVIRVQRRSLPRAVGVAMATVALLLAMVAGAALANEPQGNGGGGGGGSTRLSLE
jgi:hypothetical protein